MIAPTQYLQLSPERLETLVRRFTNSVMIAHQNAHPDATDRDYVNRMLLKSWEDQLLKVFKNPQTIQLLETDHRLGKSASALVATLVQADGNALSQTRAAFLKTAKKGGVTRVAFKAIIYLFAFRRADALAKGEMLNFNIVHSLPREVSQFKTGIDSVVQPDDTSIVPISWVGSQAALAALLLTLRTKGYISDLPPAPSIQKIFTNAKSIDQYLRPGASSALTQGRKNLKADLLAFEGIRINKNKQK